MHKIIGEKKDMEVEGLRAEVKRLQEESMEKAFERDKAQMLLNEAQIEVHDKRVQAFDLEKALKSLKT